MTGPRRRKYRRRCLRCGRIFDAASAKASFCSRAHFHEARADWYAAAKKRAEVLARPVPPETERDRAKRRADEIAAKNLADPAFMAEFHRTMDEALARAKAPDTPGVPS